MLTQEEIQFIKKMYSDYKSAEQMSIVQSKVDEATTIIAEKFKPLLEQAEDVEDRKALIEQMTLEAKTKEEEIRNN